MTPKTPVPKGLKAAGRSLWRSISGSYELRADEKAVLEQASKVADTVARLDAELVDAPLTVQGSAGQLREHPLLSEARQQRALLGRLLHQLHLPEDASSTADHRAGERVSHARRAARERWSA